MKATGESKISNDEQGLVRKNANNLIVVRGNVPIAIMGGSLAYACDRGESWGPLHYSANTPLTIILTSSMLKVGALTSLLAKRANTNVLSFCPAQAFELPVTTAEGAKIFCDQFSISQQHLTAETSTLLVELALQARPDGNWSIHVKSAIDALRKYPGQVILFVRDTSYWDEVMVLANTEHVVQVQEIRPDRDAAMTFKLSTESGSALWLEDSKSKLISLLSDRANATWRREPFLHEDPEIRLLLRLHHRGKTLSEIGEILQIDKSTVKRRLDKLRPAMAKQT